MSGFRAIMGQSFIVELTSSVWIKTQIELIFPTKLEARFRECIIAKLCAGPSLRKVGRVCGDFVADDARTHILFVGKTEVFLGGYIAEHRCPVPSDLRRTDRAGDVIVTGCNVRRERPQGIEGSLETVSQLF